MFFSKKQIAFFKVGRLLGFTMIGALVLAPLKDFHGHEEAHSCAEIGIENVGIQVQGYVIERNSEVAEQLVPASLGSSHEHAHCALCWFVSTKHLSKFKLADLQVSTGDAMSETHTASRSRIRISKYQRGPPLLG